MQELISGKELGDRKLTQLLCRIQQLLSDKLGTSADANSFLRQLFLQQLPPNVRMVLASADSSLDLKWVAGMADKVMEVITHTVASISTQQTNSEVTQLHEEVARLADLVTLLTHNRPRSQHQSSFCTRRRPSPAPKTPTPDDTLCLYHAKFGEAA